VTDDRRRRGVPLARALSKLGLLSRAEAIAAIRDGRVAVDGRIVLDPATRVAPERVRLAIDGEPQTRSAWRTILLYKPRGVVTTRRDPEGRRTVFDLVPPVRGLVAVGRLDRATSGLLLLTTDTRVADWITDPANAVPRVYVVTVRGSVDRDDAARLRAGIVDRGERLVASDVALRKTSRRESHLTIELREGKNREVRRLLAAIGHEVTSLKRVQLGGLDLGRLEPGRWRDIPIDELRAALPEAPIRASR
jgi:23S rRNA pseudouridine2605 synthase